MIESLLDWISQHAKFEIERGTVEEWEYVLYSDGTAEFLTSAKNKSVTYGPTNNFGGYLGLVTIPIPDVGKDLTEMFVEGQLIPQASGCIQSIARELNGVIQILAYAESAKTIYSNYACKITCKYK